MRIKISLLICLIMLCSGCTEDSLEYVSAESEVSGIKENKDMTEIAECYDYITVHICGEVYFPGVYTVYSGSRVYEVVRQAGGFTEYADTVAVNQAKEVSDGQQIVIPSLYETEDEAGTVGLIDINKATEAVLCTIPGIGTSRAKQIIDYRKKNGDFEKIEDIMKISGIKEGIFEKIAPYITVS